MNTLTKIYERCIYAYCIVWVAIILALLNTDIKLPTIIGITITPNHINLLISIIFPLYSIFAKNHLWKFICPQFNFHGAWEGSTEYKRRFEEATGNDISFTPQNKKHELFITQTALSISIAPTSSTSGYRAWYSVSADLTDTGVNYAYVVHYDKSDNSVSFPDTAYGYENLISINNGHREKPNQLSGDFYHCTHSFPAYSGKVTFKRKICKSWFKKLPIINIF